jgi:mannitol/fructose-specific phosphotransferase system IIA component (Ntr-type)
MNLADYIAPGGVLPRLVCKQKEEIFARLIGALAESGAVGDQDRLLEQVLQREREAGTAVGGGLALPHARSEEVRQLQIAVATLAEPLDLPTEDGQPVDIVMLIVAPQREARQMLRVLARVAKLVSRSPLLDSLRRAGDRAAMTAAFAIPDS